MGAHTWICVQSVRAGMSGKLEEKSELLGAAHHYICNVPQMGVDNCPTPYHTEHTVDTPKLGPIMNSQTKSLDRSPMLQEIQERLHQQMNSPVLASSPVVREMQARKEEKNDG